MGRRKNGPIAYRGRWRKEEVDAARLCQERGNETGKVAIVHGSAELCEATPISPSRRVEEILEAIRTETCIAPRHVDASRDFCLGYLLNSNKPR